MAVVRNTTKGTVLADHAEVARSVWRRTIGLMGRAGLSKGAGMVFPGEKGVHTHFMRFPIDVLFYAKDGRVLATTHSLKPWRFSAYHFEARGLVELPAGSIEASATERGDVIAIEGE